MKKKNSFPKWGDKRQVADKMNYFAEGGATHLPSSSSPVPPTNTLPAKTAEEIAAYRAKQNQDFAGDVPMDDALAYNKRMDDEGVFTDGAAVPKVDFERYQNLKSNSSAIKKNRFDSLQGGDSYRNESALEKKIGTEDWAYYKEFGNNRPLASDYEVIDGKTVKKKKPIV